MKYVIAVLLVLGACFANSSYAETIRSPIFETKLLIAVLEQKHAFMETYREGVELSESKQYDASIQKFLEAQAILDVPEVNFNLGDNYYQKGEYEKAEEYFNKTIEQYAVDGLSKKDVFLSLTYAYKLRLAAQRSDFPLALEYCKLAIQYSSDKENETLERVKKDLEDYLATTTK